MHKLWKILLSRRLAVILLAYSSIYLVIHRINSGILPSPNTFWYWGPNLFLIVITLLCTIERIYKGIPKTKPFGIDWVKASQVNVDPNELESFLKEHHLQGTSLKRTSGQIWRSGQLGWLGSIIFHISLVIIALGIIISSAYSIKSSLLITEGENKSLGSFSNINISLDWLRTLRSGDYVSQYEFALRTADQSGEINSYTGGINQPIEVNGFLLTLQRVGIAPYLEIKDKSGRGQVASYVNLVVPNAQTKDKILLPNGEELIFSMKINNQGAVLTIDWNGVTKEIREGETWRAPWGTIFFGDWRHWGYFGVVKDSGLPIIYFGFVLAALGLVLRFIRPQVMVIVRWQNGLADIWVAHSYRSNLFMTEILALKKEGFS